MQRCLLQNGVRKKEVKRWSNEKRRPSAEQKAANEFPESKRNELKLRTIKFEEAKLRTIFDMLDTEVKS